MSKRSRDASLRRAIAALDGVDAVQAPERETEMAAAIAAALGVDILDPRMDSVVDAVREWADDADPDNDFMHGASLADLMTRLTGAAHGHAVENEGLPSSTHWEVIYREGPGLYVAISMKAGSAEVQAGTMGVADRRTVWRGEWPQ